MFARILFILTALVLVFTLLVSAQEAQKQEPEKKLKKVPATYTSPASGAEMYKQYCASCHGLDGKGNGPAAPALKAPIPDLTTMAKRSSDGKFPYNRVYSVINGTVEMPAHGSKEMPVWGRIFWRMSEGHQAEVQQRVVNLTKYIEKMQVK